MKNPRFLKILHHRCIHTYRFSTQMIKEVQNNPKLLNLGNQSQHKLNKKWQ
jgi:hypothetical protein